MEKKALVHKIGEYFYFTTDEQPQAGDWYIDVISKRLSQSKSGFRGDMSDSPYKKVCATTNPELFPKDLHHIINISGENLGRVYKIPTDFVEEYVKQQGAINQVMLETEYELKAPGYYDSMKDPRLKLTPSGNVIWSIPGRSREELLELGVENMIHAWESLPGGKRYTPGQIDEWLLGQMKPAIDLLRQILKDKK